MQPQRTLLWMVLVTVGLLGTATVQAQTTVVVDNGLGTQVSSLQTDPGQPDNVNVPILGGELLMISANGTRTAFSDFGNAAQGPIGSGNLGGTAWVPSGPPGEGGGSVAVTDAFAGSNGAGALFLVNPSNGQRTLLSDFGNGWQGLGENPVGVAYVSGPSGQGGTLYVADRNSGTGHNGVIFAVDPVSGNRIYMSDFGNGSQGALGVNPIAIAAVPPGVLSVFGASGGLVVLDNDAGLGRVGAIFTVDFLGNRTYLSDFSDSTQGLPIPGAQAIAVAPTLLGTSILVTDNLGGTNSQGALWRISSSGVRTLISDFGVSSQGPQGITPSGIAPTTDHSGNVLVTDDFGDQLPSQAQIFLVTPGGQRTIYSRCAVARLAPCRAPMAITQY